MQVKIHNHTNMTPTTDFILIMTDGEFESPAEKL